MSGRPVAWCEGCRRLFALRLVIDNSYIPPKSRLLCEKCAAAVEKANDQREKRRQDGGAPIYGVPFERKDES